jgi:hypothetical protein
MNICSFGKFSSFIIVVAGAGLLLLANPLLAAAAAGSVPAGQSPGATAQAYLLWLVVGGAGMFGGFLFGIKDKKLTLPHRTSRYVFEPGFVGDCLFGLAGGFLVFILLPGNFAFDLNSPEEIIKIVAVAVVGAYGGRALVERVLSQQFYELENDVEELRRLNKQGGIAIALLHQHLDDDLDTPLIEAEDLKQAILSAPASVKVLAFDLAQAFRNENYETRPVLIERTIPIFEALILDDAENRFHRNHGELGYVYKDKPDPDWKKAEAELTQAIEIRDKERAGGFILYELNRALCRIKLGAPPELIKADLDKVLQQGPRNGEWVRRPDPKKGNILIEWLKENEALLRPWLEANEIQLGLGLNDLEGA